MAESEGFEPSKPAKARQFSRLVYSTALPALRRPFYGFWPVVSMSLLHEAVRLWPFLIGYLANLGGASHVLLQGLWNCDGTIFTLIVFKNCNQGPAHGKAATV